MKPITDVLPDGWEKKMRELGAFTRVGDYLKTPEDVLRLLLLWGDFGTFGLTAAFLKTTGDFAMSKVAVFQRVQKSEAFLQWLAVSMCREHHFLSLKPSWLCEYRVLLADATKTSRPGSCQADDTLHCLTELFSLSMAEMRLTGAETGETLKNFTSLRPNDLIVADRAYGTIPSMRWAEEHGAFYIFRLKADAFHLYIRNEKGEYENFDLKSELNAREGEKILSFPVFYRKDNAYYPVRVCAKRKTDADEKKGLKKILKSNHGREVTQAQKIYNRYIVVISNLPFEITAEQILELYRMRWQIELVFMRLKSILKYDEIQTKSDGTSRAWLHCKLLMSAICEVYVQRGAVFSPSGEIAGEELPALIMAGITGCLRGIDFPFA